jgi:diguanylate cyclase (GGDEF)-like protein
LHHGAILASLIVSNESWFDLEQDSVSKGTTAPTPAWGIRSKVLALVVVSALLPTALVGTSSYWTARNALTEKLSEQLNTRASLVAARVAEWFQERSRDTRVFARSSIVVAQLERVNEGRRDGAALISSYLGEVYGRFGVYETLAVLDARRRVVATAGQNPDEDLSSIAATPGDVPSFLVFGESGAKLWLQSPVLGGEGKTVGWLVLRCGFESLREEIGSEDESARVRLTAAPDRLVLAHPQNRDAEPEPEIVPQEGSISEYRDSGGVLVLAAGRALTGIDLEDPLFLTVTTDWDTAFAAVSELGRRIVLLSVLVAALVIALGYGLVVSLTRPLERLTEGAQALSRGNYSLELPIATRDEIGSLTEVFNRMTLALKKSHERLERLSETDELTKLFNRRQFRKALDSELSRADRKGAPFSLIMIDIDHFKAFNDRFGHLRGDELLEQFGEYLPSTLSQGEIAARYGGEEFVVILPGATTEQAAERAESIRKGFEGEYAGEDGVTLSLGVGTWPSHGQSALELIDSADRALYDAKERGRNRVVVANAERSEKHGKAAPRRAPRRKRATVDP